jgi:hypothetical protein
MPSPKSTKLEQTISSEQAPQSDIRHMVQTHTTKRFQQPLLSLRSTRGSHWRASAGLTPAGNLHAGPSQTLGVNEPVGGNREIDRCGPNMLFPCNYSSVFVWLSRSTLRAMLVKVEIVKNRRSPRHGDGKDNLRK